MSGSVSGSLWGLVLGSVGLGVVSLVNEQPDGASSAAAEVEQAEPQAEQNVETAAIEAAETPVVDVVEISDVAPVVNTAALVVPLAPELIDLPTQAGIEVGVGNTAPAVQRVAVALPSTPPSEQPVVIVTQPASPPPAAPEEAVPEDVPAIAAVEDTAPEIAAAPEVPDVQIETPDPVVVDVAPEPATPVVEVPAPLADAPIADNTVDVTVDAPPVLPQTQSDEPAPTVVEDNEPPEEVADETQTVEVSTGLPTPAVRVNRPDAAPSETAGQGAEIVEAEALPDDAPALQRYAATFEATADLPLIAIVVIDDNDDPSSVDAIAALPVPVTVVIDALKPGAAAQMTAYRDAGVEVMLQTSLPTGAMPTDVEIAFEAAFAILPQTVGLFSDASGLVQGDRAIAEQVVEILAAEGRGLVVVERGLGGSLRIAEQAGLPAAAVLRDLDGNGEDQGAVSRSLDQAAFRARQNGNAVLLARSSSATLAALQNWSAENNGDQIALAPASAVLRNGDDTE